MNSRARNRLVKLGRENAIAIMDEKAVTVVGRDGFAQLLQSPGSRGVDCDITVHNPPGLMFDDYQDIEQSECCKVFTMSIFRELREFSGMTGFICTY
jgi:hypothetical protein